MLISQGFQVGPNEAAYRIKPVPINAHKAVVTPKKPT